MLHRVDLVITDVAGIYIATIIRVKIGEVEENVRRN
jgi:hypothetical protein